MSEKNGKIGNKPKILGLDISTKTVGFALFNINDLELLELTHFSPKIKPKPDSKIEELLKKADAFKKHLYMYKNIGIEKIIIEEPLLTSNNLYTVGTLLRYNTMILKNCHDVLNVIPEFISTYNARKFAFPELMGLNKNGKKVLFGGYPKDIDKKHIIWEHVNEKYKDIKWIYGRTGNLRKENYDMADSVVCVIGHINMNEN